MKKLYAFTLLCLLLRIGSMNGQAFYVGDTISNYHLVNASFSAYPATPCNGAYYFHPIDIDNDSFYDIVIYSTSTNSCSFGSNVDTGMVVSSNTGCELVYGPSVLQTCTTPDALSDLSFGTPLTASLNWSVASNGYTSGTIPSPPAEVNFCMYTASTTVTSHCGDRSGTFYMGFRKAFSSDTLYGWLLMDSRLPGKIISWACQTHNVTTGVNALSNESGKLMVFPNPSHESFEIKSSKEETVMISNELGQTLQTHQLNPGNNFSVKVSGLPGGVYFAGNSSRRQKIVVIGR